MARDTSASFLTSNHLEVKAEDAVQYGRKGMRWGFRKDRPGVVGKTAKGTPPNPGKPGADGAMRATVKGKDGQEHPLSKEGEATLNAARKLSNAGFGTLTNSEIKAYTERIKLEDELVKTLQPPAPAQQGQQTSRPKADGFLKRTLKREGENQAQRVLNLVATQAINKQLEARGVQTSKKKK